VQRRLRWVIPLLALAGAAAAFHFLVPNSAVERTVVAAVRWARREGTAGVLGAAAIYFGAVLLGLPTSLLTLAAGFLYGFLRGSELVIVPSLLGAAAAFALARSVGRERIARKVYADERTAAISDALGERPILLMTLLRLSPVLPSNLLNYVFALSGVGFGSYLAACFLSMVPGTVAFAYAGSAIRNVHRLFGRHRGGGVSVLYWLGLGATAAGALLATRLARRALDRRRAHARGKERDGSDVRR
jgi:uncharacterized membrane protein YdjX (TVP38/TMEM64 family)